MTTQSNAVPQHPLDAQEIAPAAISPTRPLYWSVRRELWENRSIYIAPLAVAAVYMLGFLISLFWLPRSLRGLEALHDATPQPIALAMPYSHAAMLIMVVGFLVGIFYSLDALHGERRDRSILFWKSLPVSDLTTVLAKASVPLADSAGGRLRDHGYPATHHAAGKRRSPAAQWCRCRNPVASSIV